MILEANTIRVPQEAGLDLHCELVYYSLEGEQRAALAVLRAALKTEPLKRSALEKLGRSDLSADAVKDLLRVCGAPGTDAVLRRYLEGLAISLEREVARRRPLARSTGVTALLRTAIQNWEHFDPEDRLEIRVPRRGPVWVDYISRKHSPRYDGAKGNWDRDTQYMFEMNFVSGLFIWLSMHTAPEFRGRRLGVSFIRMVEGLAREMGFRRFTVPGPNPRFWCEQFGYGLRPEHDLGQFIHEVYREDG